MEGFTSFSERFGEEPAFALMQSLAKLMEDAVRNQGGVVQGFTGDGIMAVFGAPVFDGPDPRDDFNGATQEGAGYFQYTARNGLRRSGPEAVHTKPALHLRKRNGRGN